MLKQIGIAAACGIALYGIARYVKNNYVIALNAPDDLADLLGAGTNVHDDGDAATEVRHECDDLVAMPRAPADAAVAEMASTDTGQTQPPDGAMQAVS